MANFKWQGKDKTGRKAGGELSAYTETDALESLKEQGYTETKVKRLRSGEAGAKPKWYDRLPAREKLFFIESLLIMVRTGVPLLEAINGLEKEAKNKVIRSVLATMKENVLAGRPLNEAFRQYNRYFTPLYAAMIEAGEASGRLKEALDTVYVQVERDYDLRSKIKTAIVYPSILVVGVLGVMGVLFGYVLPKLKSLIETSGVTPAAITRFFFGISDFITGYPWLVFLIPVVFITVVVLLFRKRNIRVKIITFFTRLPFVGKVLVYVQLTRFCRSLSSALVSGLSFPEALRLTAQILQGRYQVVVSQFVSDIEKGVSLTSLLEREHAIFPASIIQIVGVGEKTGELPAVLSDLAGFYEKETDTAIKSLIGLVEPVLILFMGIVVGLVVISIVATIFTSIYSQF